jgi:iron-sulfur cluster assembly accessory protein
MAQTQETTEAVSLTPEAAQKAMQFMTEENLTPETAGLRVSVLPGGCSGFQYGLNIEDEPREDDEVVVSNGVKLFVDPFSMQYLKGTQIGYHSSFQGSGFTFSNPNAAGGCGCGSSFAV